MYLYAHTANIYDDKQHLTHAVLLIFSLVYRNKITKMDAMRHLSNSTSSWEYFKFQLAFVCYFCVQIEENRHFFAENLEKQEKIQIEMEIIEMSLKLKQKFTFFTKNCFKNTRISNKNHNSNVIKRTHSTCNRQNRVPQPQNLQPFT